MNKNVKITTVAGFALYALAAFFSIALLCVLFDSVGIFSGDDFFLFRLGKLFTGVYGLCSILIPAFLLVCAFECFSAKWRVRTGVLLLGSIVPFFTLDALEHLCRIFIANNSGDILTMKLGAALLTGVILVAVEYLVLSIIGEAIESAGHKTSEGKGFAIGDKTSDYDAFDESADERIFDGVDKKIVDDGEIVVSDEAFDDEPSLNVKADFIEEDVSVSKDLLVSDDAVVASDENLVKDGSVIVSDESLIEDGEVLTKDDYIEENPFEHIFDEQDEEIALDGEDDLDDRRDFSDFDKEELVEEIDESDSVDEAEENKGSENFLFEDFDYATEIESVDDGTKKHLSALNDDSDGVVDGEGYDGDIDDDVIEYERALESDEENDESDFEENYDEEVFGEESVVAKDVGVVGESAGFDEKNENVELDKSVGEDDWFGEETLDGDTGDGEDDLLDFVEKRNSSFESIFEQMKSDAQQNPVMASEEDGANQGGDLYKSVFDDNEDIESDGVQEEVDDGLSDLEFDPTAAPVVDSNGMPFGPAVPFEIEENSFEEVTRAKKESRPLSFAEKAVFLQEEPRVKKSLANYKIPVEGILQTYDNGEYWVIDETTTKKALDLKQTLAEFNIDVEVTGIRKGPVVTMFEVLPAPGVNVNKIRSLQDNIALRLAAISVRIVSPIPGKSAVGIEIPNKTRAIVSFREILETQNPLFDKMSIPVILGKDISGEPQVIDLAKTPHLLIAGSTGSGKSVCVNSLILSILYKRNPSQVKLILIDPKVVELKLYNDIPHLLTPVITEPKKALQALQYCLCEMERRYALLDNMGVRDITSYNRRISERKLMQEKLPYIVIIIDEFADLMATTGKELESNVARLAAMSRAVGIHLVLATQRPSVNVITGLIKANIPSRIAFMVASRTDSNIIIDQIGAEKLLGKGDMLYASATDPFPVRIQGTLVSDDEVEKVVEYVKQYGEPDYIDDEIFVEEEDDSDQNLGLFSNGEDSLYDQALEIVMQSGKASASYLQRRLKIGYNRAARLVEEMEERGIVGPQNGSKPREVIYVP